MTTIPKQQQLVEFAKGAALAFSANSKLATYSEGEIEHGAFLAIRWGLFDDCILVVKLDEDFDPVNFQQAIKRSAQ